MSGFDGDEILWRAFPFYYFGGWRSLGRVVR